MAATSSPSPFTFVEMEPPDFVTPALRHQRSLPGPLRAPFHFTPTQASTTNFTGTHVGFEISTLGASCSKHLIWIKMIRIWKSHFFLSRIRQLIRIWKSHFFLSRIRQFIHLCWFFKINIGLDHPDPDTQFSRLPNPDYQCSIWVNISQCGLPAM